MASVQGQAGQQATPRTQSPDASVQQSVKSASSGKRKIPHRITVACTICRNQHLRCDGSRPTCTRCSQGSKRCVYKDIRRQSRRQLANSIDSPETRPSRPSWFVSQSPESESESESESNSTRYTRFHHDMYSLDNSAGLLSDPFAAAQFVNPRQSKSLDGFYTSFFKGHPFVLPKARLINQFDRDPNSVAHVMGAIAFIGSLYIMDSASQAYRAAVETAIANGLPPNGFSVQCLLLYAGALEWSGEQDYARSTLDKAKSMALRIGLQSRRFASEHSHGCLVLAESWRRTWWELYIIDAIFAGIRHLPTFELWHAEYDADLPCEEMVYIQGNISPPRTLQEYDDRAFEDGHAPYSSFAYLIDAARMLGATLSTVDKEGDDITSQVKNAEANITSWHLYLPESKKEPVQPDGSVDETMFRAHMLLNTVTTHLHRPRSRLHYSTMEILCSRYAPPQHANLSEVFNQRHTMRAINAAKACVELFTLSTCPTTHTPFIMCMGSMAAATHMSACEYYLKGPEYAHAKDRVRVFLGVLRAFEGIWPQARKWSGEIKLMAKAVFDSRGKDGDLVIQNRPEGAGSGLGAGIAGLDLALLRSCFES